MDDITREEIENYTKKGQMLYDKHKNGELSDEDYVKALEEYKKEAEPLGKNIQKRMLKQMNKSALPVIIISIIVFIIIVLASILALA